MSRKVLLVDADVNALGALAADLRAHGVTVFLAGDPSNAVEQAFQSRPDVILVARSAEGEGELGAAHGEDDAGEERSQRPGRVELGGVEGHRVPHELAGNELRDERLPHRDVEPTGQPRAECEHRQTARRRPPAGDDEPQPDGEHRLAELGEDQHLLAVEPVREGAADNSHHHHRDVRPEAGHADAAVSLRQIEHHVGDGCALHPPTGVRDQRRDPEDAELPVAESDGGGPNASVLYHHPESHSPTIPIAR